MLNLPSASPRRVKGIIEQIIDGELLAPTSNRKSQMPEIRTFTRDGFGLFMKNFMYLKNYTVNRLALDLGVTRGAVYNYLKGVRRPTKPTLERMCKLLGANATKAEAMLRCIPANKLMQS